MICHKRFFEAKHVTIHMLVHSGEETKIHQCDLCDYKYEHIVSCVVDRSIFRPTAIFVPIFIVELHVHIQYKILCHLVCRALFCQVTIQAGFRGSLPHSPRRAPVQV